MLRAKYAENRLCVNDIARPELSSNGLVIQDDADRTKPQDICAAGVSSAIRLIGKFAKPSKIEQRWSRMGMGSRRSLTHHSMGLTIRNRK
jgi:hypothetical protein